MNLEKKSLSKINGYLLYSVIITLILILIFIFTSIEIRSLMKNAECTNGVIYELTGCSKNGRTPCLRYNYIVDGIKYKDRGSWYPKGDFLSVGDTIIIIYDKTDPANSKPKYDFEECACHISYLCNCSRFFNRSYTVIPSKLPHPPARK